MWCDQPSPQSCPYLPPDPRPDVDSRAGEQCNDGDDDDVDDDDDDDDDECYGGACLKSQ